MAEENVPRAAEADERALGRAIALGLPLVAVVVAATIGALSGLGPALLVLAGGALLGTISFFWASVRTLSGDAPLAQSMTSAGVRRSAAGSAAGERKRAALRALKDLELEHSVGKIDDDDYADLVRRYRDAAKTAMRELDEGTSPLRERAEEIVRTYLAKRGVDHAAPEGSTETPLAVPSSVVNDTMKSASIPPPRTTCAACGARNDPDAAFCKKCGDALPAACRKCGTRNDEDAAFCKKCGTGLDVHEEDADVSP